MRDVIQTSIHIACLIRRRFGESNERLRGNPIEFRQKEGKISKPVMEKARFISRPNRFTVRCALGSEILDSYLPNPGRLWELLLPDSVLYVVRQKTGENRKLGGLVVAVERDGRPVMLHTHACNDIVADLLCKRQLPGFEDLRIVQREISRGSSRFDFLLERDGAQQLLEVKSCTLFGRRIAMFPDAVTSRGKRHLTELAELSRRGRRLTSFSLCTGRLQTFFCPITIPISPSLQPFWPSTTRSDFMPWQSTGDLICPWDRKSGS